MPERDNGRTPAFLFNHTGYRTAVIRYEPDLIRLFPMGN